MAFFLDTKLSEELKKIRWPEILGFLAGHQIPILGGPQYVLEKAAGNVHCTWTTLETFHIYGRHRKRYTPRVD